MGLPLTVAYSTYGMVLYIALSVIFLILIIMLISKASAYAGLKGDALRY